MSPLAYKKPHGGNTVSADYFLAALKLALVSTSPFLMLNTKFIVFLRIRNKKVQVPVLGWALNGNELDGSKEHRTI